MPAPVLIISTAIDTSTDAVINELERRNVPVVRFNTENFPFRERLVFCVGPGQEPKFEICNQDVFRSIWYRRVRTPECPSGMDTGHYKFSMEESKYALIGTLLALSERIPTLSNPQSVWAAEYKPYQLAIAKSCGFKIPNTLIGNSPEKVTEMYKACDGKIIAKPVRTGYLEDVGTPKAIYTSLIKPEHIAQVQRVAVSPAIFQPMVEKKADIRVTVVGDSVFSALIESQSDKDALVDWRKTSNPELPHHTHELPKEIRARVLEFMKTLKLKFGAIDFVLTNSNEYIFLEINPNGQWLWLDRMLGLGITNEIANWLEFSGIK